MKMIRITALSLLMIAALGNPTFAGDKKMKKHTCTEACKKEGKCVMAHGEKGHTCTDACKKAEEKKK